MSIHLHWKKPAGRYPGYETTKTTVFVSGGETTRVFVSLVASPTLTTTQTISPDTGTAYISSDPQGAEFSLDLVFRGITPLKVMWIEKGTHTIVITREGYEPWQSEITVQNASNYSVDARLVPVAMATVPATTTMSLEGGIPILAWFGLMVLFLKTREF